MAILHRDPAGGYITRVYTDPTETPTWTKPTGLSGATIIALGAGGAGGSGRRGLNTTNRLGGGGGGGGAYVKTFFPADSFAASYIVTVGTAITNCFP